MDGSIFTVLQTVMNFKSTFYQPSEFNDSQLILNENLTKVYNIIENEKADINAISTTMQGLDSKNILFLQNIDLLRICYLVPKKIVGVNFLVSQFNIIDFPLQILTAGTFVILTIYFVVSIKLKTKIGKKPKSTVNGLLVLWQIINSAAVFKIENQKNRIILASIMFYSLIICSTYQGIAINRLMQEPHANEINTLEEVDKSGLEIISTIFNIFKPSTPEEANENLLLYRLYKKHVFNPDIEKVALLFSEVHNMSAVFQIRHAQWFQALFYDAKTGKDWFHIVKERALYYQRSFMVPKTSPFRERMNECIFYAIEFGFYELGHVEGNLLVLSGVYARTKAGFYKERTIIITFDHIWPIMVFLGLAYIIEIFVFLLEIFIYRYFKCKRAGNILSVGKRA